MKKQTHPDLGRTEDEHIYIFGWIIDTSILLSYVILLL